MRRALDGNPFISTKFAEPGYGYFGKHAGYDYGIKEWTVKAPEAGVITNVRIAPLLDGGNIVELRSEKYDHRFLHLKSAAVSKGQTVTEGQDLGVSGNTGKVGYHLHHDVRKKGTLWTDSFDNYYDWEALIKQGGKPNMPYIDQSVLDGLEAWKRTGQTLSFDPAYEAMGGKPGDPLTGDTSGITTVMNDFRKNKEENLAKPGSYEQVGTLDGQPIYRKKD